MANANGWGDGASNNNIGWGKGADNAIGWGAIHADSYAGLTDIVGTAAFDADAQAFITAAVITDVTQQNAINTLVVDLKGYSIWTKMKAIYPIVGGTASQHKFNLKDPRDLDAAFRLTYAVGWTHSATGMTPNGATYADTKLIPNTTLSLNSTHISGYLRTTLTVSAPILSAEDASTYNNGLYIWPKWSGGYSVRINDNTSQINSAGADIRGLHLALRTASNVKKYRFNNTQIFNVTTSPKTAKICSK